MTYRYYCPQCNKAMFYNTEHKSEVWKKRVARFRADHRYHIGYTEERQGDK